MEKQFLISKIYGSDGGSIHFKKVARDNGHTVKELAKESFWFGVVEYLRRSKLGRALRRMGLVARIEFCISLFFRIKTGSRLTAPTDSLLFILIVAKSKRPVLYSYDLPWTYYRPSEREFIKRRLRSCLVEFESILCISHGMLEAYSELGLKNLKLIDGFIKEKYRVVNVSGVLDRRPLYLGNVRFPTETSQLVAACNHNVVHYGSYSAISGMLNAGFKDDITTYLRETAGLYFGLCVFSFDARDYDLARSSIPSKILTYNDLGIPIVYYGPEYSEGFKLVAQKNLGLAFSSLTEVKNFFN